MPERTATRQPAEIHPAFDWKLKAVDGITLNFGRLIKAVMWVLIARYGYYSILALAGKQTLAQIALRVLGSFTVSQSLAWASTGGAIIWAGAERRLRKRTIRLKANRIRELEEAVDVQRSSSRLMPDGSTRPEDE